MGRDIVFRPDREQLTQEVSMMAELDKDYNAISQGNPYAAAWTRNSAGLRAGISAAGGYDIGVGKYLKLPEQQPIIDAAIQAFQQRKTLYWDYPAELPSLIAAKLREENGILADPATEIGVFAGMTSALSMTCSAFLNPGDEVLVMDPDYVTHFGCVAARSARLVFVPFIEHKGVLDESRWEFDPAAMEARITSKTRLLILTNPNNPIGYVYSRKDLEAIAEMAIRHDLLVLTNECYERLVFSDSFAQDLKFTSLASLPGMFERTITVQGITKGYHMSGLRVGWIVAEKKNMELIRFVDSWSYGSNAPTASQWAACAALSMPFRQDYIRLILPNYKRNRDIVTEAMKDVPGVECARPMGSQFTFMDVRGLTEDDQELAAYLARRDVITVAGNVWGDQVCRGHLRLALSNPSDYEQQCAQRLREGLLAFGRERR